MPRAVKPFRVIDADGEVHELKYYAPYSEEEYDEMKVLEKLPWYESGKPLKNWMLHDIDLSDEVEKVWGKRWGAEGIGRLREVLVSRPTENETRKEYAKEYQYYYSTEAGTADLSKLQQQFDDYYKVLKDNGVRVNYVEPPVPAIGAYGYLKNMVTLAGAGLVVRGGVIIHRMGLGSWQRGREVIWSKAMTSLQVPIYLTIHGKGVCEPGAGRWLDGKKFVFNECVVANEEGLRQVRFVLENLGLEMIETHSPGWINDTAHGDIGTTHMDMVLLTADLGLVILYPALVNYSFVRYLQSKKVRIIEVPKEEYWGLAVNGVNLAPGKVVLNNSTPRTAAALRKEGVDVIELDFSESHKFAIAGLHCATCELIRDQPSPLLEELPS